MPEVTSAGRPNETGEAVFLGMVECRKLGGQAEKDVVREIRDDWCRERGLKCCLPGQPEAVRVPGKILTRLQLHEKKDCCGFVRCVFFEQSGILRCAFEGQFRVNVEHPAFDRKTCPACGGTLTLAESKKPLDEVLKEAASA